MKIAPNFDSNERSNRLKSAPAQCINVVYPAGRGPRMWSGLRDESGVPDEWPYGLNRLRTSDIEPIAHEVGSLNVRDHLKLLSGLRSDAAEYTNAASISWDEGTAQRMLANGFGRPLLTGVIWATDEIARGQNRVRNALIRSGLRKMDGLWCLSRAQVDPIKKWIGTPDIPVSYLRFGVDKDYFRLAEFPAKPMILSAGNDVDRDIPLLYETLDVVHRARPHVELFVQTNSQLTPPRGITVAQSVSHSELRDLYARSSLVLVATKPNLHVSGMTVALEAKSSGRPVVITDSPGMDDYVRNGVDGYVNKSAEANDLSNAAVELVDDLTKSRAMGLAGRESVEACFNTGRMACDIAKLVAEASK